MFCVYEFELFPDEGWILVEPCDFEGATEGHDWAEAEFMAADWLRTKCEYADMYDEELPKPTFGNEPRHPGGKVVCIAVVAGKETVRKVSASEAARMLGVTPGRVTQMLDKGLLSGWREGHHTWVTVDSVNARLADKPRAGRPRKAATA